MLTAKRNKVCGLLAIFVICACSSNDSPTSINAEPIQQGENEDLSTPNAEFVSSSSFESLKSEFPNVSSSSEKFNSEFPIGESSSATIENVKKSKFEPVETQILFGNENDDLYLSQLIKYSNYIFLSDSVYSYESVLISYDEDGRETLYIKTNNSVNGNKTSSNGESRYYKYDDGKQINYQNVFSETESIIDNEISWVIYHYTKYKTINDESQTESESVQTTTKELISSSNEGKEYILRTAENGNENSSYTKVFLDSSGSIYKTITYNADNSFSSGNIYLKLPNAPEAFSKGSMYPKPIFDEASTYEYYDVSCKDVISTSETYQYVVDNSYKIKNFDRIFYLKYVYTYNRFEF